MKIMIGLSKFEEGPGVWRSNLTFSVLLLLFLNKDLLMEEERGSKLPSFSLPEGGVGDEIGFYFLNITVGLSYLKISLLSDAN